MNSRMQAGSDIGRLVGCEAVSRPARFQSCKALHVRRALVEAGCRPLTLDAMRTRHLQHVIADNSRVQAKLKYQIMSGWL
jgi:hypothetical protein